MKKLLLYLALAVGLFGADAANDLLLSQRKADNSGNIQRNVAPTTSGFLTFNASKVPTSPADLTYATPTFGVPDAFNINSAGSISLTAGGSNKSVTVTPTGTGVLSIPVGGASGFGASPFVGISVISSGGIESGLFIDGYGTGATNRFVGRGAGGTPSVPTATPSGMTLASFTARGHDGSAFSGTAAGFNIQARGAWDTATPNRGTSVELFYTPFNNGTATRSAFSVNGPGTGLFRIGAASTTVDFPAWAAIGVQFNTGSSMTYRDSSSSTGTVATAVVNSFNVPTISALNASVVYTNLANVYIAGDVATTGNASATNSYGLWNVGKTRLDGPIVRPPATLTYANPTSVNVALASVYTVTTVNATGSVTFNATAAGTAGQMISFIITNDATSAKTITFGTNFTPNGTLTASGVSKKTTIQFISDGTSFIEVSRTVLP